MARYARFKVSFSAPLDGAHGGTVSIDRVRNLFAVRPLRRRREYVLPLPALAEFVVFRVAQAEARDRAKAKKEERAKRRAERRRNK